MRKIINHLATICTDKYLHYLCGLCIAQLAAQILAHHMAWWLAFFLGFIISVVAGLLKEWYDRHHGGTPDMADTLATTYGGLLGVILLLASL